MMYKKQYQMFADAISELKNKEEKERFTTLLCNIFKQDNSRFSEGVFREWIRRKGTGESLKGLKNGGSKKF